MKKYEYRSYDYNNGDYRTEVVALENVYIAYITMGGSGLNIVGLKKGGVWREGPDEIIGVFDSYAEAEKAIEKML